MKSSHVMRHRQAIANMARDRADRLLLDNPREPAAWVSRVAEVRDGICADAASCEAGALDFFDARINGADWPAPGAYGPAASEQP